MTCQLCLWLTLLGSQATGALIPPSISPPGGFVRSPALVTIDNPNPAGAVFYTLDGSDPRGPFGNVAATARNYSSALSVNRSLVIRARVKSGTNWSDLAAAAFTADQDFSTLLFTELMYHPTDELGREQEEFVELKNVGLVPLDVSGLRLRDLTEPTPDYILFSFPPRTVVPPGGFLVLAFNTNVFQSLYPGTRLDGALLGGFNERSGLPALITTNGAVATVMRYDSHAPWQVLPDNHGYFTNDTPTVGFSLVRTTLDPAADPEDFRTWRASAHRLGSPGEDDPEPAVPPIYINELLTRPGGSLSDSVELFNPNTINVHLGGWWLSDSRNWPYRYQIPHGTIIPASGFLVLDESHFNTGTNSLSFDSEGERCYLFSGDTNGNLTGYSHGFFFRGSERDVSFGRNQSSDGSDYLLQEISLTFGATNSGPRVASLMMTEINYHPGEPDGAFVELSNTSPAPLALWEGQDPEVPWGFGNTLPGGDEGFGPSFFFPPGTTLLPNARVLLVSIAPEVFRASYDVPADVPIYSLPPEFALSEVEGTLRVFRPSGPRWVVIDEVYYKSRSPWDPGAAGGGQSLERVGFAPHGNDPVSWRASPRSPGRENSNNLEPSVWAGGSRVAFVDITTAITGVVSDDRWPATALTSQWTQVDGPALAEFGNDTAPSTTVTFRQTGRYTLRLAASDGVFTNADDLTVDVIVRPFDTWRQSAFTSAELGDELISGPGADPDGDGLTNLEEYFFVTEPKLADSQPPLQAEVVSGDLIITWLQRVDAVDVTPLPRRADRIEGPWFDGPGLFESSELLIGAKGLKRVALRSLLPTSESGQQFISLQLGLAE